MVASKAGGEREEGPYEYAFQNEKTRDKLKIMNQELLSNRSQHIEAYGKLSERIFSIKDDLLQIHVE